MITDTERLDFVMNPMYSMQHNHDKTTWVLWDQSDGLWLIGKGSTMREAIDAAINKTEYGGSFT